MTKSKNLRSRCGYKSCGKQFRHADARAKFCSAACRQADYRNELKKAAQKPVLSGKYALIAAAFARKQEAERQGEELERSAPEPIDEPSRPSEPAEAAPQDRRGYLPAARVGGPVDDTPRPILSR